MKLPTSDADIAAWVSARLAALDTTPRNRTWRADALGMPRPVALAMVGRRTRVDFETTYPEMRIVKAVAESRGLIPRAYVRRAVATALVVCDDVAPDMIPTLCADGLLGPP